MNALFMIGFPAMLLVVGTAAGAIWWLADKAEPKVVEISGDIATMWRKRAWPEIRSAGPYCPMNATRPGKVTRKPKPKLEHTVIRIGGRR